MEKASRQKKAWQEAVDLAAQVRAEIAARLSDQRLPSPEEILRQIRRERDEQLLELQRY